MVRYFLGCVLALLFVSCSSDVAEPEPTLTEYYDLAYGTSSTRQQLDIFLPTSGTAPYPVVLLIHGGSWEGGNRSTFYDSPSLNGLLEQGFAVVPVGYRLSGEAVYPAQIHDIKGAIRYLRANAGTYSLDTSRMGAWGFSAGAHLAVLAATSGDAASLEGTVGPAGPSSRLQAVADWFGPVDLLTAQAQVVAQGCPPAEDLNGPDSPITRLLGFQPQTNPTAAAQANPITFLTANDPPMLIAHGLQDCTVPFAQSQQLYDSSQVRQGPTATQLLLYANSGHGSGVFATQAALDAVVQFLAEQLQ
ncbi:MAG: alpha/beta hydrolase [Bacteroidia bacterium]|nr:alpha/beta hydrolase [Bacteroidia bacterium]